MGLLTANKTTLKELGKDEFWLQDLIAKDPKILGLGDLILEGREVQVSSGGRVDLILLDQNTEPETEYLVEVQLGPTDPSHIIRAIEYWDLRRNEIPSREHCAVLVAEEITGRFFNVINLIKAPIIAIEVSTFTLKCPDGKEHFTVIFNRVYDNFSQELSTQNLPVDRNYWIKRSSNCSMLLIDALIGRINRLLNKNYKPNYTKYYVGLKEPSGRTTAFINFYPRKNFIRMNFRLPRNSKYDQRLDNSGLDYSYDNYFKLYSLKIPCPRKAVLSENESGNIKASSTGGRSENATNKLEQNLSEVLDKNILSLIDFFIKEAAAYNGI